MQMTRQEKLNNYDEFVEKFTPQKTTDDCYTPPGIYDVVKNYVCKRWNIDPKTVVRPFWPGWDYETIDYSDSAVVIDNPPFSILSKIIKFYLTKDIDFFLFCPSLTALSSGLDCNHIICDCGITYENGAVVHTSFVTSFGRPNVAESCPELTRIVNDKMAELLEVKKKRVPKYAYPRELVNAAMIQRYSKYGITFEVKREECALVRSLDAQRAVGKAVYGAGLLLSKQKAADRVAADRVAADRAAADRAADYTWELSDRERRIVEILSKNTGNTCKEVCTP